MHGVGRRTGLVSWRHERAGGPAHLQRVGEHRPRAPADPGRPCPTPPCWSSTTAAPTAPPTSPRPWARSSGASSCCAATASPGSAAPTGPGSAGGSTAGSTPAWRWTPTCPTSPRPCPGWWRPVRRCELAVGSRYVAGGVIPNWAWHRRLLSRGGNVYASALLGLGVADSTSGFRAYAASILRRIDLDRDPGRRLRVPDRDDLPRPSGPGPRWWRCPSGSSTGWRASRRCPRSSWSRPWVW